MPMTFARAPRAASPACARGRRSTWSSIGPASPPQMSRISCVMRSMCSTVSAGVDAALEAVPGVGREVEAPRAPGHRLGPPERGLDVDVARVVRHRRGVAAHDAGQRLDGLRRRRSRRPAHRPRWCCRSAASASRPRGPSARRAPPWILSRSKMCERPAELEHHVVRDVDQRRDRALAAARQALDHPRRRRRLGVDVADRRGRRSGRTGRAPRTFTGSAVVVRRRHRLRSRRVQRRAGQRRDLARDAVARSGNAPGSA